MINPSSTSSKTYWSIIKTFFNGKKIPLIPPLNVSNKLVADFKEKARLFNEFFASKCTPITNDSSLPRLVAGLRHMKNKGVRLSHASSQNSDAIAV